MNKKTVAVTREQYIEIIGLIRSGFVMPDGHVVKPNHRIATVLVLEANLGVRISDILKLRLVEIIRDGDRYRLDIIEKKTKKKREFTVPLEVYSFIQNYALENNINPAAKLFDITDRAVQNHVQLVCTLLGYEKISTHSFRKFFATSIYNENGYNIMLVCELLQHASVKTTMRYIGIGSKQIETALHNHIKLV